MITKRAALAAIALPLILCLSACSADQITTTLELAVDAAIAATPAIEAAAHVSPQIQATVSAYLTTAETCLTDADSAVNAPGATPASTAAAIAGSCGNAVIQTPGFPQGTPSAIVAALGAVASAIATFLQNLQGTAVAMAEHPQFARSFADSPQAKISKAKAAKIHKKILELKAKLAKAK
jgi:hypothetical protein